MRIRDKILSTCLSDLEKHPGVWQSFEHKNAIDYFVIQTIFLFLTKILIFFNLAYYMCGAEPAGNIPAPMLQQYIYKRKKRGKTNGKEKIK